MATDRPRPTAEPPQVRDLKLVKLYFGHRGRRRDIAALAQAQLGMHRERLAGLAEMQGRLRTREDRRWQLAVAECWARLERVFVEDDREQSRAHTADRGSRGYRRHRA